MDRKTDQSLVEGVADRKITHTDAHVGADRVVVDRDVVHLDADAPVPESMEDRRAVLHSDGKEVVTVTRAIGSTRWKLDG
jgi:hypothetical protein